MSFSTSSSVNIQYNIKFFVSPFSKLKFVFPILLASGFTGNMPDYGTYGNFKDGKFEITPMMPKHCLFITGVPKGAILDNFRVRRTYWSSYYEDDVRGYLFQITDESIPRLIITN